MAPPILINATVLESQIGQKPVPESAQSLQRQYKARSLREPPLPQKRSIGLDLDDSNIIPGRRTRRGLPENRSTFQQDVSPQVCEVPNKSRDVLQAEHSTPSEMSCILTVKYCRRNAESINNLFPATCPSSMKRSRDEDVQSNNLLPATKLWSIKRTRPEDIQSDYASSVKRFCPQAPADLNTIMSHGPISSGPLPNGWEGVFPKMR